MRFFPLKGLTVWGGDRKGVEHSVMRALLEVTSKEGVTPVWGGQVCVRKEGLEDDSELGEAQQVRQVGQLLTRLSSSVYRLNPRSSTSCQTDLEQVT